MTSTRLRIRIRWSFPAQIGSACSRSWPRPPERPRAALRAAAPGPPAGLTGCFRGPPGSAVRTRAPRLPVAAGTMIEIA